MQKTKAAAVKTQTVETISFASNSMIKGEVKETIQNYVKIGEGDEAVLIQIGAKNYESLTKLIYGSDTEFGG